MRGVERRQPTRGQHPGEARSSCRAGPLKGCRTLAASSPSNEPPTPPPGSRPERRRVRLCNESVARAGGLRATGRSSKRRPARSASAGVARAMQSATPTNEGGSGGSRKGPSPPSSPTARRSPRGSRAPRSRAGPGARAGATPMLFSLGTAGARAGPPCQAEGSDGRAQPIRQSRSAATTRSDPSRSTVVRGFEARTDTECHAAPDQSTPGRRFLRLTRASSRTRPPASPSPSSIAAAALAQGPDGSRATQTDVWPSTWFRRRRVGELSS